MPTTCWSPRADSWNTLGCAISRICPPSATTARRTPRGDDRLMRYPDSAHRTYAGGAGVTDGSQLTAEDRSEIQNLLAHYVKHLDTGDLDGYVSLFADDAVLFERHHG